MRKKRVSGHAALLQCEKAEKNLCAGHYEIAECIKVIKELYQEARDQEKAFTKKLKRLKVKNTCLSQRQAQILVNILCKMLGVRSPKVHCNVGYGRNKISTRAWAWYEIKNIKTKFETIGLITVLHELAHHLQVYEGFRLDGHEKGFLEAETLLFDTLECAIMKGYIKNLVKD